MEPYVVAAAVAATVGAVEQANRLGTRFTLKNQAWMWWGVRLLLEGGLGVLAVAILRATETEASEHAWSWIAAGASGPAVARLRVLELGKGDESRPIGVATAYEPVRSFVEEQIHKRSAEHQAGWINTDLLPSLDLTEADPALLASYVVDYLKALPDMPAHERQDEIDYILKTRDGSQPDRHKRAAIVRHAILELNAFRLIDRFESLGR